MVESLCNFLLVPVGLLDALDWARLRVQLQPGGGGGGGGEETPFIPALSR